MATEIKTALTRARPDRGTTKRITVPVRIHDAFPSVSPTTSAEGLTLAFATLENACMASWASYVRGWPWSRKELLDLLVALDLESDWPAPSQLIGKTLNMTIWTETADGIPRTYRTFTSR